MLLRRAILAKWNAIFSLSDIRILTYVNAKGQVRYSELLNKVVNSRSTLAKALRDLQEAGLVNRTVKGTRPIKTYYTLTDKGTQVTKRLEEIKKIIGS